MRQPHTKILHPAPARAREVDLLLEAAVTNLRRYCGRLGRGRIHLWVDVHDRSVVGHSLECDFETSEDIDRMMREPPRKVRA